MEKIPTTFIGDTYREDLKEFEELFKIVESFMGYLPNAHLTMSERPELLKSFSALAGVVFQSDGLDAGTKQLIALASSLSAGCKYCQAHTSHGAEGLVLKKRKLLIFLTTQKVRNLVTPEKAVLDLAFAAGKVPNNSNQEHFDNLSKYYSKKGDY